MTHTKPVASSTSPWQTKPPARAGLWWVARVDGSRGWSVKLVEVFGDRRRLHVTADLMGVSMPIKMVMAHYGPECIRWSHEPIMTPAPPQPESMAYRRALAVKHLLDYAAHEEGATLSDDLAENEAERESYRKCKQEDAADIRAVASIIRRGHHEAARRKIRSLDTFIRDGIHPVVWALLAQ